MMVHIKKSSQVNNLKKVLVMLATAFIGHAQPVVNHLPKKRAPENDEIPIILIDSRSQETT